MYRVAQFMRGRSLWSSLSRSLLAAIFAVFVVTPATVAIAAPEGSNVPSIADVNEAGRVLATLDDWRAIMFVLIFVLIADRIATFWQRSIDRKDDRQARDDLIEANAKLSSSIDRLTDLQTRGMERMSDTSAHLSQVVMVHQSRVEMIQARVEALLSRMERDDDDRPKRTGRGGS